MDTHASQEEDKSYENGKESTFNLGTGASFLKCCVKWISQKLCQQETAHPGQAGAWGILRTDHF